MMSTEECLALGCVAGESALVSTSLSRRTLTNRYDGRAASRPAMRRTFNLLSVTNVRGDGHVMSCRTFLRRESEYGWHMLLRVSR